MLHNSKVMDPSGSSAVLTQPPLEDVEIPGMSGDSQATGNGMEMGWKWDVRGHLLVKHGKTKDEMLATTSKIHISYG